jgi:hypothetical protein
MGDMDMVKEFLKTYSEKPSVRVDSHIGAKYAAHKIADSVISLDTNALALNILQKFMNGKEIKDFNVFRPANFLYNNDKSVLYPASVYFTGHPKDCLFDKEFDVFKNNVTARDIKEKRTKVIFTPDFLKVNEREMYWLKKGILKDNFKGNYQFKEYTKYLNFAVNDANTKNQNTTKFGYLKTQSFTNYWKGTGASASNIEHDRMNNIARMIYRINDAYRIVNESCPRVYKALLPPKIGTLDWFAGFTMSDKEKEKALLEGKTSGEKDKDFGFVTSEPLYSQNVQVNERNYLGLTQGTNNYHLFNEEKEVLASCKKYLLGNFFNMARFKWGRNLSYEVMVKRYEADKAYRDDQSMSYLTQLHDFYQTHIEHKPGKNRYLRRIEFSFHGERKY